MKMNPLKNRVNCERIAATSKLEIYYNGPHLDNGSLPAFFYFALSAEDSLTLDPFNQPVAFLQTESIRVFSFTIPGHGQGYENKDAMKFWASECEKNPNFLQSFLEDCLQNIEELIGMGVVDSEKMAIGGLSRGGFIATHIAVLDERIKLVLGFAPLTKLSSLTEFNPQNAISSLNLIELTDKLIKKDIRFYIGNRDERVGTDNCYELVRNIADKAYEKGIRSPTVELIINPSIGFKGHGTLPYVFEDGINWLKRKLK